MDKVLHPFLAHEDPTLQHFCAWISDIRDAEPCGRPEADHADEFKAREFTEDELNDLDALVDALPDRRLISDGADPQADNNARAMFGAIALVAYRNRVGEDELESNLSDMLSDLRHFCDAAGLDFDDAVGRSEYHYDCEISGEL